MVTNSQPGRDPADISVESAADDRIHLFTRVVAGLLVLILAIGASLLYIWPLETDSRFAWPISPAMTPLLMGSGYFAGAYYFLRLLLGRNWSHVGATLPAVAVFATVMLITTVIHWDLFTHDHLAFYIWAGVYIIAPPLVIGIWYWNGKQDPGLAAYEGYVVPSWARIVVGALGVGTIALAAVLFFAPGFSGDFWPWTISPLTSRVLAGWFMLSATTSIVLALDRRWSIWQVPLQTLVIWSVLMMVGMIRAIDDLDGSTVASWMFPVGVALVGAAFLLFYAYMQRARETA